MSETTHHSHKKLYWLIFVALAVLTALEIYIPEIEGLAYSLRASSLIGLAAGKAFLVAYFYMHLNEETAWLKFVAAIPLAAVAYAVVVILETMYR
jgi:cytochrome c oxidase subunit 4